MASRLRYPELAPAGIATMRATEHYLNASIALPAVLLELVRLRVSLRNGCEFCIGHHVGELHKHNEPESRIEAVQDWISSDAFTPKERAALAWADAVTDIQVSHASDADYAAVSAFFHEKDLVDLTLAIASINAWNRMSMAFAATWDPRRAQKALQGHDLGQNGSTGAPASTTQVSGTTAVERSSASVPAPTTSADVDAPTRDVVDEDGGKVAQD